MRVSSTNMLYLSCQQRAYCPAIHGQYQIIVLRRHRLEQCRQDRSDRVWYRLYASVETLILQGRLTLNDLTAPKAHRNMVDTNTEPRNAILPSTVFPLEVHHLSLPHRRPTIDALRSASAYDRCSYLPKHPLYPIQEPRRTSGPRSLRAIMDSHTP